MLPAELIHLRQLKVLNCEDNEMGRIPTSVGWMVNLEELYFQVCCSIYASLASLFSFSCIRIIYWLDFHPCVWVI